MSTRLRIVKNPPNRFSKADIEWLDVPPDQHVQVFEEHAKSILSTNSSPDIPFHYSVNPYRGCFHACAYCYARPTHQYIDFGAGTDFEHKLVVKMNAAVLLREAFQKKSWTGEPLVFSGVTDCYQPLEARYEITKQCLEVCAEFHNPVGIITKGLLIKRDADLLARLNERAGIKVFVSVAFTDDKMARAVEPSTPRPTARFQAIEHLAERGIPVGIALAPIICGLNDHQIPEVLERAHAAGARSAFMTLLRLPAEVKDVFHERISDAFPDRATKIFNQLKDMRGGRFNSTQFSKRMRGSGSRWDALNWLFTSTCSKLGIVPGEFHYVPLKRDTFRRPKEQLSLFSKGAR